MSEPTIQDVLDRLDRMEERMDKRFDSVESQLDRHTEILVQTQVAVSGLQRHLGLVPA